MQTELNSLSHKEKLQQQEDLSRTASPIMFLRYATLQTINRSLKPEDSS